MPVWGPGIDISEVGHSHRGVRNRSEKNKGYLSMEYLRATALRSLFCCCGTSLRAIRNGASSRFLPRKAENRKILLAMSAPNA